MTSKKSIIIYSDYKDFTIALICALIGFIYLLINSSESDNDAKLTTVAIFVIPALVSFKYSIKSNINLSKAILSFIIKISLSLILLVKFLQLIVDKGDEPAEVREKTKKWQIISTGIFSFFVFELIKEHRWNGDNPSC